MILEYFHQITESNDGTNQELKDQEVLVVFEGGKFDASTFTWHWEQHPEQDWSAARAFARQSPDVEEDSINVNSRPWAGGE